LRQGVPSWIHFDLSREFLDPDGAVDGVFAARVV
jgi:hypothetical protein